MSTTPRANILVVDDLPENHLVLTSVLDELGQHIITASSGEEALQRILEKDFAVILLDVNMPGIDGFETAQLIRRRKRSSHTPIIFTTAYADEMHKAQGYSLGAVDYILTPIVPEILRSKVKVFVELFQMTEQIKHQAEERVLLAHAQAARAAAEETNRRSTFLAEASKILSSSLNLEVSLNGFMRLLVPALADLGVVTLLNDQGRMVRSEMAWVSAPRGATYHGSRTYAGGAVLPELHRRVIASGKPELVSELPLNAWETLVPWTDASAPVPDFPVHAALVLPLAVRSKSLGVLTLRATCERGFRPDDVALAQDLAGRAAVAIDNAMLYRDIQESDRRKSEFLAMLSHELRNPLASISNAAHILRLGGADAHLRQENGALIQRQVAQLVRLVDDLLDISRITRGKIRLQMQLVELAAVVTAAVDANRPLLEARRHALEVSLQEEPIWLEADPFRLSQILGNLLNNAAKYTEAGGRVWLTVSREGGEAVLRVRDNGMGIPPEMLSTIFEMFTQADQSLDRSQGGLGIGLTLVERLVAMHGGAVQAYSEGPGRGSEFVVRLPALPETRPADKTIVDVEGPFEEDERRRILIVEDNEDAAQSLAKLLRMLGHDVHICHDGNQALTIVEAYMPDVVLLDIGLPGLDGYQVALRMQDMLGERKPMLVALTGYGQEDDLRQAKASGFDHHFVKPLDPQALAELLAKPIQARGIRKSNFASGVRRNDE